MNLVDSSIDAKVESDRARFERREPLDFCMSSVVAEDWLLAVKGLVSVNAWPFSYTLQYLRMHVEAVAKDWFIGRSFRDWAEFEKKFRTKFVRASSVSDRLDLMKARKQGKNEGLMDYFQPKMRMCRELSLSFKDAKDYLLRGLYANLALYVVGRRHVDEVKLLEDLLSWDRMNALHQPVGSYERKTEFAKTRPAVNSSTSRGADKQIQPGSPDGGMSSRRSVNNSVTRWNCKTVGHFSKDCFTRRRSATCYGCGVEVVITRELWSRRQVNGDQPCGLLCRQTVWRTSSCYCKLVILRTYKTGVRVCRFVPCVRSLNVPSPIASIVRCCRGWCYATSVDAYDHFVTAVTIAEIVDTTPPGHRMLISRMPPSLYNQSHGRITCRSLMVQQSYSTELSRTGPVERGCDSA
ncbi:hypothetical protein QTP88_019290 [Uroleucon formosanum]